MSIALRNRTSDITRHIVTTALLVSFYIFENVSYGAYISILIACIAMGLHIIRHDFIIQLKFDKYQRYILFFALICLLTSIVAQHKDATLEVVISLIKTLICLYPIYLLYDNESHNDLLKAVMWCGFVVSIYTLIYFGISNVISWTISGTRLPSTMNNSNTLGMCAAFSVLIMFNYLMKDGFSGYMLLSVPAIIIVAVSGSRKALFLLCLGAILVYTMVLLERGDRRKLKKIIIGLIIFCIALLLVSQTSMFDFVLDRVEAMLQQLSGSSYADNSTRVRLEMIKVGWKAFRSNPILGVGIANTRFYFGSTIEEDYYYLHNNFLELLAGGGLIAFISYYSAHICLAISLLKRKKEHNPGDGFALIFLFLVLFLDYGSVTYYYQIQYVYMMVLFLQMKRGKQYESEKKYCSATQIFHKC